MPDAQGLHALRGMMRELIRFHLGVSSCARGVCCAEGLLAVDTLVCF